MYYYRVKYVCTCLGTTNVVTSRKEIFDVLRGKFRTDLNTQVCILEKHFGQQIKTFKIREDTIGDIKKMLCNMKARWEKSYSKIETFEKKNKKWLNSTTILQVRN